MMEWIPCKVKKIIKETDRAKTIQLELPEEYRHRFEFRPGQFIGIKCKVNGEEVQRSYSISSPVLEEGLQLTIKAIEGGQASHYLVHELREGVSLCCSPPEGRFTISPRPEARRRHYFIAGGSGITPIFSLMRYLLEAEPKSECYLLYGNKDEGDTIFRKEIESLKERYAGQFFVQHSFSQKPKPKWNIFNLDQNQPWYGRIDSKKMNRWLKAHPHDGFEAHYFVCGPGTMNQEVYTYLTKKGIPSRQIHVESFLTAKELAEKEQGTKESSYHLVCKLNGEQHSLQVVGRKPILEALLDEGVAAPHSCTSGACASCIAKVEEGEVEMDVDFALSDEEKEEGYVLTCQSRPVSYNILINYDV